MDPAILDLPWQTPLEDWPEKVLAALPRGISRHTVRFVRLEGTVLAVKEIKEEFAHHEYKLLRQLKKRGLPCVTPVAVVGGRHDDGGEELDACLVTKHLRFSLPYRALFSQGMRPETLERAVDALALLLVRVHLAGMFWGDVSLSNALFRRDADQFAGYVVDVETAELREQLSNGQREHDLEIARVNMAGEFMDLQAAGVLDEDIDPIDTSESIIARYRSLWDELTGIQTLDFGERWKVQERINRLNTLGFDVEEMEMTTDDDGTRLTIRPMVVDAGFHSRRLMRLTGLDAQENQARRLLIDLQQFQAATAATDESIEIVAHRWLQQAFEPVVLAVPRELRRKIEPAQVFHEVLEHQWYMSEQQGFDVSRMVAVVHYIANVLAEKPDEESVVGVSTSTAEMPKVEVAAVDRTDDTTALPVIRKQ